MKIPHPRFTAFLLAFVVGTMLLSRVTSIDAAVVWSFDAAALLFLGSAAPLWRRGTPDAMRAGAARDDGGRVLLLGVSAIVLAVILVALGTVAAGRAKLDPADIALVVATLVLAWGFANLVYAFHYAHLFYDRADAGGDRSGLEFPGGAPPDFSDFCYFSFVLGMTFQVSDVVITDTRIRRVATFHGLLAFFFNLGTLALTINVLASAI